jgi:putative addiction module CopG family antidote
MVTLTADVTEEIRKMTQELVEKGMYKSQSEVVRDAIRQLSYKYAVVKTSAKEARAIVKKTMQKTSETLATAVRRIREE